MLNLQEFFAACTGQWTIERTYHHILKGEIEKSHTEYTVTLLASEEKQQILSLSGLSGIKVNLGGIKNDETACPGFAIAFDTRSETGEEVSMRLKALFVPDLYVIEDEEMKAATPAIPVAAEIPKTEEVIRGLYLRDEGYSEAGAIASRFTYLPTRQTLEMISYYRRSVALDQMRFVAPDLRVRTIINYKRPEQLEQTPTVIDLLGFGVEHRHQ